MKFITFAFIAIISLTACQIHKNAPAASEPSFDIPEHLDPQLAVRAQQKSSITEQDLTQIKADLKTFSLKIPNASLALDKNEDSSSYTKDVAKLDVDGQQLLKRIKDSCDIKSDEPKDDSGKPNSTQVFNIHESITGASCPVRYLSTKKRVIQSGHFDPIQVSISGRRTEEIQDSMQVMDENLKKKIRLNHVEIKSTNQTVVQNARSDDNGKLISGAEYVKIELKGQFFTSDGVTIPILAHFEGVNRKGQKDFQGYFTFTFPQGELRIGLLVKNDVSQAYVNGRPATFAQILEDFGIDLSDF